MPHMRKFFESFTEDLFQFNILLIPFGFLMGVQSGRLLEPISLMLFLPLLLYFYFLRKRVKRLSVFLLATWLTCLIGIFTPHKIFYTAFIAFLCAQSVRKRTNAEAKLNISFELLCFPLVFLAVLYTASGYLNAAHMRPFIYGQATAIFMLALLYTHLKGINAELELASASSLQSTRVITGFANKFLAFYAVGFFIVLVLFRYMPFGSLFLLFGRMIRAGLRFLFSLISDDGMDKVPLPEPAASDNALMDIPPDEAPLWLRFIERAMIYVVNILFLLAIIAFVVMFFLHMYRGFYSRRGKKLYYRDQTSEVKTLKRPKRRRMHGIGTDNAVRRKYYRRVNKYFKRKQLMTSDTPEEIKYKLRDRERLDELTPLYEKARYGENR